MLCPEWLFPPHCDALLLPLFQVVIKHDGVTKPFEVRKYRGEGMPVHNFPSSFGDLHVKFNVVFPPTLNAEQQNAISNLF